MLNGHNYHLLLSHLLLCQNGLVGELEITPFIHSISILYQPVLIALCPFLSAVISFIIVYASSSFIIKQWIKAILWMTRKSTWRPNGAVAWRLNMLGYINFVCPPEMEATTNRNLAMPWPPNHSHMNEINLYVWTKDASYLRQWQIHLTFKCHFGEEIFGWSCTQHGGNHSELSRMLTISYLIWFVRIIAFDLKYARSRMAKP